MKKAGRIYINQWHSFKSPEAHSSTDTYYLNLCNEVKQCIYRTDAWETLESILDKEGVDQLCCYLTAYLEDLVSDTNIWNTFVQLHQKLYDKPLPYYDITEYYEGEVNYEDVCFLIWYFLNCLQEDEFVSHLNVFILQLGEAITDILIPAWEEAPENQRLKATLELPADVTDFYLAKEFMENVFFGTYLLYPDTGIRLRETMTFIAEENAENENLMNHLHDANDHLLLTLRSKLLALKSSEWTAEVLGDTHPLHEAFKSISPKINSVFLYKGANETYFTVEHIASGRIFEVRLEDFVSVDEFEVNRTIMMMGIVRWKEEWWFSGVCSPAPYNESVIEEQRVSFDSQLQVYFLQDPEKVKDVLSLQLGSFLKFNKGQPIAFMKFQEIGGFINEFREYYEEQLPPDQRQLNDASKVHEVGDTLFDQLVEENPGLEGVKETMNALVFFNPKAGLEVVMGLNELFPFANNDFFTSEQEIDSFIDRIFFDQNVSTELAEFFVESAKEKFAFFNESMGLSYIYHLDFLLRFWKNDSYQTAPSFSLVNDPAYQ